MLDRLSATIPLVDYKQLDIRQPALVRVLVNAQTAKDMLMLNVKNRRQRRLAVEYLKQQIESGEWRDDHPQPVIFSDQGRLIDGQHRLQAISETPKCQQTSLIVRVETGARDDVREYLDTGVSRTLEDRVEFVEDTLQNKIIAQLCTYHAWFTARGKRPSPEAARDFFISHQEALEFIARNHRRDKGVGKIQTAYAAMQYYEINKQKCSIFYPALFVRDGDIQQARMLRDYLLSAASTASARANDASHKTDVYQKSVGCMKAHKENRKVTIVRRANW